MKKGVIDLGQLNSIREQLNEWMNIFKANLGRSDLERENVNFHRAARLKK
ncbi:hypothetical protein NEOC65_002002 [Neochlamydia sp. AcF65]|nr:hypothetical protein [Neochlamydia sp. AcF65]